MFQLDTVSNTKVCIKCGVEKLALSEFYSGRNKCIVCYSNDVNNRRKDKRRAIVPIDILKLTIKEQPLLNLDNTSETNNLTSFDQFSAYIGLVPGQDNIEAGVIYFKYWLWCQEFNIEPESIFSYNRNRMENFKCIKGHGSTYYKIKGVNFILNDEEKEIYIRWRNKRKKLKERDEHLARINYINQPGADPKKVMLKVREAQGKNPVSQEETLLNFLDSLKDSSQK